MLNVSAVEKSAMRKVMWRLIPFAMLQYIIAIIDRVNIGFAALQMNKELGIDAAQFGLLAGIFFLSYCVCEIPSNVLALRFGIRNWLARILISWGIVTIFLGFAQGYSQVATLRFLLGIAEAGFFPCIILYLTFWFPARYMGRAVAYFMIATPIANIVTGPFSTWIIDNITWFGMSGWRHMFILQGIPAIIIGLITLWIVVDRPANAKYLTAEEKEWLKNELDSELEAKKSKLVVTSKWAVMKEGRIWHLGFSYITYVIALYGLGLWLPQILRSFSAVMTNTQIGLISVIPYAFAGVVMVYMARRSDRTGERRLHCGLPISIAFFGLIALTYTKNMWLALTLLALSQAGIYCYIGTWWTIPNAILGEATAAVGIAFIASLGNLGGFVGPYIVGWLKSATGNMDAGMYFLATSALLCTISVLAVPKSFFKKSNES